MTHISDRVQSLSPSQTLAMSQKSNELKAQGIDVINLSVGEPDFNTPDHIKEAAKRAIDENFTFYTAVPGYLSLRKAIADKLKNENGLDYTPEQIVVSGGAKQSLCNVILSVINPGDEVVIPTPAWVSYVEMVKLAEGTNVLVPASIEQDFKVTPEQLEAAITPKTRRVLVCSPSNPTGSVYTKNELKGLVEVLAKYPDVLVLADEIYEHINYVGKHESIAQFEEIRERVIIVNGVSKAYAMTGWRIGFAAGAVDVIAGMVNYQSQSTSAPNSAAQHAAAVAYTMDQSCVEEMRQQFEKRRNYIVERINAIPGISCRMPDGAFYVMMDISELFGKYYGYVQVNDSMTFAELLLENADVAVVPGSAFCSEGFCRLSYATSMGNIQRGLVRIAAFVAAMTDEPAELIQNLPEDQHE